MMRGMSGQFGRFSYNPAYSNNIARGVGPLSNPLNSVFADPNTPGLWLEAKSSMDYEWQDNLGTTPVTAVNQTVGLWGDRRAANQNNVSQATTTTRPTLQARVNVLSGTESFSGWTVSNATIAANTVDTTDPLGGNNATKFTETAGSALHRISLAPSTIGSTATYVLHAKAGTAQFVYFDMYNGSPMGSVQIDLNTGTQVPLTDVTNATGVTTKSLGNGWWEISVTSTATGANAMYIGTSSGSGGTRTTAGGNYLYLWGADLRSSSDSQKGYPYYQRVNTASDYDTAGFPFAVRFDGVDDVVSTATFTVGTLTSDMDLFVLMKKNNTNQAVIASQAPSDGNRFLGSMVSGGGTYCNTNVGAVDTLFVNGTQVGGIHNATTGQLYTAVGTHQWVVVEFRDLDLSTWNQFSLDGYSSFMLAADFAAVIVCPAQSNAVRQQIRTYLGNKVGLAL